MQGQWPGLKIFESLPIWWYTYCWCNQYLANPNIICDFDMDMLRTFPEDAAMRYCLPYAAARKAGRPKIDKCMKSPLEGKKKRKSTVSTQEDQLEAIDIERTINAAPSAPRRGKRRSPE